MVFLSVTFASYGTPGGSCGSFTVGTCHATNSKSIVEAALVGKNSGSIAASNAVFGDPCNGTVKRLTVEAFYSAVTPLHLLSFSGVAKGEQSILQWQTVNEVNTKEFVVERSSDGRLFTPIGVVKTNNRIETNNYSYSDNSFGNETCYYRLKMMDSDGSFEYSKIVAIKNTASRRLQILSNPVSSILTLNRLTIGSIELVDIHGKVLQKVQVKTATLNLNLSSYSGGVYFIRYSNERGTEVYRIVKQ
jgi:hypothetical protein